MLRWALLVSFLLLSGCAPKIYSNVTVFHELPPAPTALRYAAVAFDGQDSLEHKSYLGLIKAELGKQGYVETPVPEAQVVMFVSYGIDNGAVVETRYPVYGQVGMAPGFGAVYTRRGVYPVFYGAPVYGQVGEEVSTDVVYTRSLKLELLDAPAYVKNETKKLYEAKVVSQGAGNTLPPVLPVMIKALFEDFPGRSGSVREVALPMEK